MVAELMMNREKRRVTVFKDETKLFAGYTPKSWPHRDEVIQELCSFFKTTLERPGTRCMKVLITGGAGSGKTCVVKAFGTLMEELVERDSHFNLEYIHINCDENTTLLKVLHLILQEIRPHLSQRGESSNKLIQRIRKELRKGNKYIIVCLDDADSLFTKNAPILEALIRPEEWTLNANLRLSLVLTAKTGKVRAKLSKGVFLYNICEVIYLPRYRPSQLENILRVRAEEAYREGVVLDDTIRLISQLCRSSGNAREAINILRRAGNFADKELSPKVTPHHARQANESLKSLTKLSKQIELDQDQKLIFLAISQLIERKSQFNATKKGVWKEYQKICDEYGIKSKGLGRVLLEMWILEKITGLLAVEKTDIKAGEAEESIILSLPLEEFRAIVMHHLKDFPKWDVMKHRFST